MHAMRSFVPFVLVFLALFIAACIAYIAWELSAEKPRASDAGKQGADESSAPHEP